VQHIPAGVTTRLWDQPAFGRQRTAITVAVELERENRGAEHALCPQVVPHPGFDGAHGWPPCSPPATPCTRWTPAGGLISGDAESILSQPGMGPLLGARVLGESASRRPLRRRQGAQELRRYAPAATTTTLACASSPTGSSAFLHGCLRPAPSTTNRRHSPYDHGQPNAA
jgi:hypothetical protein